MILFMSNVDSELLAFRSAVEDLPAECAAVAWCNPIRTPELPSLGGVDAVVVRLLGGSRLWEEGFTALRQACAAAQVPLIAAGGEAEPDAELVALSTVPAGVARTAHSYLAAAGPANLAQLIRFVSDTVLFTGVGFEPPVVIPNVTVWDAVGLGVPGSVRRPERPLVAVVFYRAHLVAGDTAAVRDLAVALDAAGADVLAIATYSLRANAEGRVPALELCRDRGVEVIITSILAAGTANAEGDGWSVPGLDVFGIPVIQSPSTLASHAEWQADDAGLRPIEVASGIAVPEFDGRIIGPTFAFKEIVDDDAGLGAELIAARADPERTARLAALAVRTARLGRIPTVDKRVALMLSAYPTKRSRLGNAVGLDTPASAIELLRAMRAAGYRVDRIPDDGDTLMDELATGLTYDQPVLTDDQVRCAAGSWPVAAYDGWFATLPDEARDLVEAVWGPPPGEVYVSDDRLWFTGIDLGNVLVTIQPPRGFGSDPIGTYHAPDIPPPHHYLATYRWLAAPVADGGWGADAIVHLGKHGTMEWLPGKALALSGACFPDIAIADVPLFYPFVVNDPGEGTQAKRRAHAVIVDHLPPPMTRAETYDELARLEQLLDGYAQSAAMDPAKLPAIRAQVWEVLVAAQIHRDLALGDEAPDDESFDDVVNHVDGYLCALKDAQIRGGLHVLGTAPRDEALVDDVLAITRQPQGDVPSLRATVAAHLGVDLAAGALADTDRVEAECRARVEALAATGWDPTTVDDPTLHWVATTLVPNLRAAGAEITNLLAGLDGHHLPAGPSGAPTRGAAHVLPTGRNFYSVDPKAIPSRLAWQAGSALADRLVERHLDETGTYPRTVGLVMWGTAAMRTNGDDIAEALALLGVRPVWEERSQRVTGLEVVPLAELGRSRIDVTMRISGFFRDAFPHVVALLDDAVRMVAELDEDPADNPIAASGAADARLWGPPPGGYGSGILPVIEQRSWRSDEDLAEVYLAWSGFAYGRNRHGDAAPAEMRRRFAAIEIAVKNQDNREHDIFDSDDYLQDHGGMVAAVRSLTGQSPRAWFGDTADPANPRVRSLAEEAARVVRSRVINPRWIDAMRAHGYKGAFELAATVDYLFGYDATAQVVEDWMYERVTEAYVGDASMRAFFQQSNPWALRSIAERLLEAAQRGMWNASDAARATLTAAVLEAETWEETR